MPESVSSFTNFAKLGISRQKSKLSPTFLSNRHRLLRSLPPLLSSRASQEELADSISKNGSLSGIAELVSPITARKISRKHLYEYSTQIAINMNRLRRLVVSLGLLWFSTFFKNGHLKVHGFMDNNTQ